MQQGKFITNAHFVPENHLSHWNENGPAMGFNSKAMAFEPFCGLLHFGKLFDVPDDCVRVMLRATALGVFDLFIDGERVANQGVFEELKPEWTDYHHRVFEVSYDITDYCQKAAFLEAEVSPGWWSGRISCGVYGGYQPGAFCAEITLIDRDGNTRCIPTDESWMTTVAGPVLRADIWDGEYYDARIPHPAKAPDAHVWENAVIYEGFTGKIVEKVGDPVVVKSDLERIPLQAVVCQGAEDDGTDFGRLHILAQKQGRGCEQGILIDGQSVILDMGQNFVGRPRLRLNADAGTKIEVFFGEMLNDSGESGRGNDGPCGSVYLKNYRSAMSRIVYICAGGEAEYFPTHTFFGFRYMEIVAHGTVQIQSVAGEVLGTYLRETGTFTCDHDDLNRLYSNIVWGMRSNYLSNPTDCPQRDERFGWTGDTQLFCGAASYMANIRNFMRKWLGDLRASQQGYDGAYADMAPRIYDSPGGNAAWGDAGIVVPYQTWLMYGDIDILAEHFDSMEAYMDWLSRQTPPGPGGAYGDWLAFALTDTQYIGAAYYAYDALLMAKMSAALGKTDKADTYRALYRQIREQWRADYIRDGKLTQPSQTGCLLALAFGLVEGRERDTTVAMLERAIVENDYLLNTGFIGTSLINKTLYACGLQDLAYDLIFQTRHPSWLYSVHQGATTVWERWNSYTKADGFGDVNMNSFNHYAYGAVAEWLYAGVCGILPDEEHPGFERFIWAPLPDRRAVLPAGQRHMNTAKATYTCRYGRIVSGWTRTDTGFRYELTVPDGTVAQAVLPCPADHFNLNGKTVGRTAQISITDGFARFSAGAGDYVIEIEE